LMAMQGFVQGKDGPGSSNPVLNYVRTFTDDKSPWQDQFHHGPGPQNFGPTPQQMQQEALGKFLDPREFEHFSPFPPGHPAHHHGPPGAVPLPHHLFQNFIHGFHPNHFMDHPMDMGPIQANLSPAEQEKIRNRSQIMSGHMSQNAEVADGQVDTLLSTLNISNDCCGPMAAHSKAAIDGNHNAWMQDWQQVHHHPHEFEAAWNKPRVMQRPPGPWSQEFENQQFESAYAGVATKAANRQAWADNFAAQEEKQAAEDEKLKNIAKQVGSIPDSESLADQFMNQQTWGEQFNSLQEGDETEEEWLRRWEKIQENQRSWADTFLNNDYDEALLDEYERIYNSHVQPEAYTFQQGNPFLGDPDSFEKGVQFFNQGELSAAVLALEAAVQRDPTNTMAWTKLGQAQAENDKDRMAIHALEQAVAIDHGNLEALMALAVSQTNEYNKVKTAAALRQWALENPKYTKIAQSFGEPPPAADLSKFVAGLFIEIARQSQTIDPDVHTALGLFYNLSYEYHKAVECFRAALTVRPDDYALWNKLGATMANDITTRNQNAEITIDAYCRALEKKPSYTRARSNLGISYMSAQNYIESAKCFMGALAINNSDHLWSSLRTSFQFMKRPDLVELCGLGDVRVFANEFDF